MIFNLLRFSGIVIFLIFLSDSVNILHAENQEYAISEVPDELMENAFAVIRKDKQEVLVRDDGQVEISGVAAYTILNEGGKELAAYVGRYDSFMKYKSLGAKIFNQYGKLDKTIKLDEIYDVSDINESSLYEDHRAKLILPEYGEYPFTIEYTYQIRCSSTLYIPDWYIYPDYNISVQEKSYTLIVPEGFEFRTYVEKLDAECQINEDKNAKRYYWLVRNLPALKYESYSGYLGENSPRLLICTNEFELDGRSGDLSSWSSMGSWIADLYTGKDELPEATVNTVQDLINDISSDKEKISVLYKYMQQKVRYVNLTIGIGGLEPIPAKIVDEVGYGDCKALSNYMKSLLEVAGIKSYVVAVYAGSVHPEFIREFPSFQANHVILLIPSENDSMWLECTSQVLPAGYLGTFTDDREVLVITEEGGKVARTPAYSTEKNRRSGVVYVKLDEDCNASVKCTRSYSGIYYGEMLNYLNTYDLTEQKRSIQQRQKLSNFAIDDFQYEVIDNPDFKINENVRLQVEQFTPMNGDYITLELTTFSEEIALPRRSRTRTSPVYLKRGNTRIDSVHYVLPENLRIYSVPDPVDIVTNYGSYHSESVNNGTELLFIRKLVIKPGKYPPEKYNDLYGFLRQVNAADNQRALIVRN